MDAIYNLFSERKRAIIDILTFIFFLAFVGILLKEGIPSAITSIVKGEYSPSAWHAPRWPTDLAIPLGALLILFQGVAKFIRDLYLAVTKNKLPSEVIQPPTYAAR